MAEKSFSVAKKIELAHDDGIWAIIWNNDKIISGSVDSNIKIWYFFILLYFCFFAYIYIFFDFDFFYYFFV